MRPHKKAAHAVYDLKVHLVWITKYRYKVLTKPVGLRIRELISACSKIHFLFYNQLDAMIFNNEVFQFSLQIA